MRLEPGTILAQKYRLDGVLGVGGMGTVYRAEHLALKAPVAIKVIDREVKDGDVTLARFMREAQAAASLKSPHVVQILDYGTEGDRPFMVMEMLEGEPLSDRIERSGRLTPLQTYRVINHIARAVARAHEADIIHRDLKPDNVFLVHNEGDEIAKVLDFGVAKVEATQLDGAGHTRTGSLLGTPYYMSPEQAQGNKAIDARSDLWALGVIAFECMTGVRPFSSEGLGDLVLQICIRDIPLPSRFAEVPEGFDGWFLKACAREPVDRFQTARELAEALHDALQLRATPLGMPDSRWSRAATEPGPESVRHSQRPTETRSFTAPTISTEEPPRVVPDQGNDDAELRDRAEPSAPTSQWQVVPHDAEEATSAFDRASEPLAPIPKKNGAGVVLFVGLTALLIGGSATLAVRQSGFLSQETKGPRITRSTIPAAAAPTQTNDENAADENSQKPSKAPRPAAASKPREMTEEEKALDAELSAIEEEATKALDEAGQELEDPMTDEPLGPEKPDDSPGDDDLKNDTADAEDTANGEASGTQDRRAPESPKKPVVPDPRGSGTPDGKDPPPDSPESPTEGPEPKIPSHLAPAPGAPSP